MRLSRYKKFQRYINFFEQHFRLQAPYKILVDGTFANAVLPVRVNMREQLPKCFDGACKLLTTPCVLVETEKLGPTLYGAVQILKGLQLEKCQHFSKPLQASECLKSVILKRSSEAAGKSSKLQNNQRQADFVVATQDANLRESFRKIPGVPLLYLHGNAPTLEKPSDASVEMAERSDKQKLEVSNYQKEILQHIKDDVLPSNDGPMRKGTKKRKRAGPNPLACKRSKKRKLSKSSQSPTSAPDKSNNDQPELVKKKRKRIKLRVPKHVRELTS